MHRAFLLESLRATSTEAIQHGACLGLGLAGLGTEDEEVYEDLKNVLYMDSAVRRYSANMCPATRFWRIFIPIRLFRLRMTKIKRWPLAATFW